MLTWTRGLLSALILLFAIPAGAVTMERPELLEPAQVIRDNDGTIHIIAGNSHDLYFLQGWATARDRLFQIDLTRRFPSGTLAELIGPAALAGDVESRTIGLRRAAELSWEAYSPDMRAAITAFADGVNTWAAENPLPPEYGFLAIEEFAPWTEIDTVVVGKALAFQLSFDLDIGLTEIFGAYLETLGEQGFVLFSQDVFRTQPFDCAATIPDATGAYPYIPVPDKNADPRCEKGPSAMVTKPGDDLAQKSAPAAGSFDVGMMNEMAQEAGRKLRRSYFIKSVLDADGAIGSNLWGISAGLGGDALPIVVNDPHLSLGTPSTFYPMHLKIPGNNVMGSSVPGTPGIIHGHNNYIAWGTTTNPMDVTDTFLELVSFDQESGLPVATIFQGEPEPIVPVPEEFYAFIRGEGLVQAGPGPCELPGCEGVDIPPATFIVPRRNNGPLIAFFRDQADAGSGLVPALSVQYVGYSATRELEAFLIWNHARNMGDIRRGLEFFDVGSQNFVFGDRGRNIAYFTSGEMPIRSDLAMGDVAPGSVPGFFPEGVPVPPWFIRDGTSGAHEWMPAQNVYPNQVLPYEILGPDEMPQTINPPQGWFVNANNDPAGTTLDNNPLNQVRLNGQGIFYLNAGYAGGFRAGTITHRLEDLIDEQGEASFEDMQDVQADVTLLDARYFVPWILTAWDNATEEGAAPELAALAGDPRVEEAVGRLALWDYSTPTGLTEGFDAGDDFSNPPEPTEEEIEASIAATIYSVWRGQAIRAIIDKTLSDLGLPGPGSSQAMTAMRALFDYFDFRKGLGASGINFFEVEGVTDPFVARDVIVLGAIQRSLDLLAGPDFGPAFSGSKDQNDYRWGQLHRITFDHPLLPWYSIPADTGIVGPLPGYATDGGFGVVDASSHSARADDWNDFNFGSGPVRRFVAEPEVSGEQRAESIWAGGASGVPFPGNEFYSNLLESWIVNKTIPIRLPLQYARQNADEIIKMEP